MKKIFKNICNWHTLFSEIYSLERVQKKEGNHWKQKLLSDWT